MKHLLDCSEIEKEYLLFSLSPIQHYERIIDLANFWTFGYEDQFKKLFEQPNQDYLEQYAESDDEWFYIYLMRDGAENHPDYGRQFDMRLFKDMKELRKILEAAE